MLWNITHTSGFFLYHASLTAAAEIDLFVRLFSGARCKAWRGEAGGQAVMNGATGEPGNRSTAYYIVIYFFISG